MFEARCGGGFPKFEPSVILFSDIAQYTRFLGTQQLPKCYRSDRIPSSIALVAAAEHSNHFTNGMEQGSMIEYLFHVLSKVILCHLLERYVTITKITGDMLAGDVIVTKNPCMHPGDLRKLTAVNVPQLHHVRDCIVFPVKGDRPHPEEMAGSDLDGDEDSVLWYADLIFKTNCSPMHYYSDPPREQKTPIQSDEK
ncbi:uncharacterized protein LOC142768362 [Rhipicephalus microplus]|uniref:uncharacterized protein LOC142768362 n=1 Tax=Rhipicephalus microplus TaxID=6941 RepID=UPI003F6B93F5